MPGREFGPNKRSSAKEIVGSHGHRSHGKSILWPALYEHLRAKGYSKEKAARISNAAWNKKHHRGYKNVKSTRVTKLLQKYLRRPVSQQRKEELLAKYGAAIKKHFDSKGSSAHHKKGYRKLSGKKVGPTQAKGAGGKIFRVGEKVNTGMSDSGRWKSGVIVGFSPNGGTARVRESIGTAGKIINIRASMLYPPRGDDDEIIKHGVKGEPGYGALHPNSRKVGFSGGATGAGQSGGKSKPPRLKVGNVIQVQTTESGPKKKAVVLKVGRSQAHSAVILVEGENRHRIITEVAYWQTLGRYPVLFHKPANVKFAKEYAATHLLPDV